MATLPDVDVTVALTLNANKLDDLRIALDQTFKNDEYQMERPVNTILIKLISAFDSGEDIKTHINQLRQYIIAED